MSDELRGVSYYMRKAYDAEIELTAARAELAAAKAELAATRAALQYARNLIGPDEIIDAALKGNE